MSQIEKLEFDDLYSCIEYDPSDQSMFVMLAKTLTNKQYCRVIEFISIKTNKILAASFVVDSTKHLMGIKGSSLKRTKVLTVSGGDKGDPFSFDSWIPYLDCLEDLNLSKSIQVDCRFLIKLRRLKSLTIGFEKNQGNFYSLSKLTCLQELGLEVLRKDFSLKSFQSSEELNRLKIVSARGKVNNLDGIDRFPSVKKLMVHAHLQDASHIKDLRLLEALNLEGNPRVRNFDFLSDLPLEELIVGPRILDSFAFLSRLSNLKRLSIVSGTSCYPEDGDFAPIFEHPRLALLVVHNGIERYRKESERYVLRKGFSMG